MVRTEFAIPNPSLLNAFYANDMNLTPEEITVARYGAQGLLDRLR